MEELKKCPFCGGDASLYTHTDLQKRVYYYVECNNCLISPSTYYERDKEEVINVWNTRKPMERIVEKLENEILENLSDCGDDWFTAGYINKAIEIVKEEMG